MALSRDDLTVLMQRHQSELYRFLCYLGAKDSEAEDLLQDVFIAAFQAKDHPPLEEDRRCAGWLRGIARNLFLQHCSRQRATPLRVNSEALEQAEAYWKECFLRHGEGFDYLEALKKCLERISDQQRRAVGLFYGEGLSRLDAAKKMGITEDGVKKTLQRTRVLLAQCIRRRLNLENGA